MESRFLVNHFSKLALIFVVLVFLWIIFAVWPTWLVDIIGSKKLLINTLLNGLTLSGLYFLVASGFTLVFGLMRIVNLAHGSLYLLGGYLGYEVAEASGNWLLAVLVAFLITGLSGAFLEAVVFRKMQGDYLRQTLVSIGISIIAADLMLAVWTGTTYQFQIPDVLYGTVQLPVVSVIKASGKMLYIKYPLYRLVVLAIAIIVGVLLWFFLHHSKLGIMVRAGVDDGVMLSATGVPIHLVFAFVFALGAGLAGLAGVIGGTALSIAPGEDIRYLLASLIVVIVGGMGSISGAALGALLIGLAEQFGLAYFPTYGVVLTFIMMIVVLALRPQGILGRD